MNIYRWIMEWSDSPTSASRKAKVLDMAFGAVREVQMDEERPDGNCRLGPSTQHSSPALVPDSSGFMPVHDFSQPIP